MAASQSIVLNSPASKASDNSFNSINSKKRSNMKFLSITDPQIWLLAGISVLVVFSILLILVLILGIFTAVAKKTTAKAKAVKSTISSSLEAKSFEKASDEDKAAVATALYLYFNERDNRESRVLTIVPYPSAWGAQLNPRL